jgi:hypothetical protein
MRNESSAGLTLYPAFTRKCRDNAEMLSDLGLARARRIPTRHSIPSYDRTTLFVAELVHLTALSLPENRFLCS